MTFLWSRARVAVASALLSAALPTTPLAAQGSHAGDPAAAADGPRPRRGAPRLGRVHFPTSGGPAARARFLEGVLYLHNFHYADAAAAFREAQRLDPGDVMSYWGEAMTYTHPVWNQQDAPAARAALGRLAPTRASRLARARTPREGAWLDAVEALYDTAGGHAAKAARDTAYCAAMARLHTADPRDPEAAAFYALSLLGLNQGEYEPAAYAKAANVAEPVFRLHASHPGAAHYLIHAVDHPAHAPRGLAAAQAYSDIAPDAGHAQHMTSHIFVSMGMWDDVVRANERAQAAVRQPGPGPQQVEPHSAYWLEYGLLQQGRFTEARRWLERMRAQADQTPDGVNRAHVALMAAAYIVDTRQWDSPYAWLRADTAGLGSLASEFVAGYAALGRGDVGRADAALERLSAQRAPVRPDGRTSRRPGRAEVWEQTLQGARRRAAGQSDSAVALLRAAAELDEQLPFMYGPPVSVKPPRELAGELLLELGRAREAQAEFEQALRRTPGRPAVLIGLARSQRAQGNASEATRLYGEIAAVWRQADPDVPGLAEVRAGARALHQ